MSWLTRWIVGMGLLHEAVPALWDARATILLAGLAGGTLAVLLGLLLLIGDST